MKKGALVQITNTSRQSLLRSADSGSKHCVPDCRCSSILNAETSQFELSLPNSVQQLDAGDRDSCIAEPLETEHHGDALLHAPMVLLDHERSLVSAASEPSAFSSRTAR